METNERAPLLSDVEIHDMFMYVSLISDSEHGFKSGAGYARNFYEAKITSGELMVVKTVKLNEDGECPSCGSYQDMPHNAAGESMVAPFCSNCGAKIVEA